MQYKINLISKSIRYIAQVLSFSKRSNFVAEASQLTRIVQFNCLWQQRIFKTWFVTKRGRDIKQIIGRVSTCKLLACKSHCAARSSNLIISNFVSPQCNTTCMRAEVLDKWHSHSGRVAKVIDKTSKMYGNDKRCGGNVTCSRPYILACRQSHSLIVRHFDWSIWSQVETWPYYW